MTSWSSISNLTAPSRTTKTSTPPDSSWVWKPPGGRPGSKRMNRARTWGTAMTVPIGSSRQSNVRRATSSPRSRRLRPLHEEGGVVARVLDRRQRRHALGYAGVEVHPLQLVRVLVRGGHDLLRQRRAVILPAEAADSGVAQVPWHVR